MYDIDYTGSRALARLLDRCEHDHIIFGIARAGDHLHHSLDRSGLLARIGTDHCFATVNAAVDVLAVPDPPQPQSQPQPEPPRP
jgi:MFS superfamily sulfate permease-like transporter